MSRQVTQVRKQLKRDGVSVKEVDVFTVMRILKTDDFDQAARVLRNLNGGKKEAR